MLKHTKAGVRPHHLLLKGRDRQRGEPPTSQQDLQSFQGAAHIAALDAPCLRDSVNNPSRAALIRPFWTFAWWVGGDITHRDYPCPTVGSLRLGATTSGGLGAPLGLLEHNVTDGQRVSVREEMIKKNAYRYRVPAGFDRLAGVFYSGYRVGVFSG